MQGSSDPNSGSTQDTSSSSANPNRSPVRQRTQSPIKTTSARTSNSPSIHANRPNPGFPADRAYNQSPSSSSNPSATGLQRIPSPVRASFGTSSPTRAPIGASSPAPISTFRSNAALALSSLQTDSPTLGLTAARKRARMSMTPSSIPVPVSSHDDMIIYSSNSTSKGGSHNAIEIASSEVDIEELDEVHEDNDENDENDKNDKNDENTAPDREDNPMEVDENGHALGDIADEEGGPEGEEGEDIEVGAGDDSEDEEEEEEEEEDEDDEEDEEDDAGSVDIGDDDEDDIVFIRDGDTHKLPTTGLVKTEPGTDDGITDPSTLAADVTATGLEGEVVNALIPKKKKILKRRASSIAADVKPAPPIVTVRLEHELILGGTLEWDVLKSATDLGLVMRRTGFEAGAEMDEMMEEGGEGGIGEVSRLGTPGLKSAEEIAKEIEERWAAPKKVKKVIKRRGKDLDYDVTDAFIDDTDIQQDAPTHMARTVQEGFFVHAGKVEVLEEEIEIKKPRQSGVKKAPRVSKVVRERKPLAKLIIDREKKARLSKGSAATPIKVDSDDEGSDAGPSSPYMHSPSPEPEEVYPPMPVDTRRFQNASSVARLRPPFPDFPKDVRTDLLKLRKEAIDHDWDPKFKGTFPLELKPIVAECGNTAFKNGMIHLGEEVKNDQDYFVALCSVLPYNSFTLTKLTVKLCFHEWCDFLDECEKVGLEEFKKLINAEKDGWKDRYENDVKRYEEDKKKWDEEHPTSTETVPTTTLDPLTGTDTAVDASNDLSDDADNPTPVTISGAPKEPIKQATWTAEMRKVFAQLLDNLTVGAELRNKAEPWRITTSRTGKEWSEGAQKLLLYPKIVDLFPDGYENKAHVSREMSKIVFARKNAKAKAEKLNNSI